MILDAWFRWIVVLAFSLGGAASSVTLAKEVKIEKDLVYGKAGDVELTLDLARPTGDGPFPAIVFIHGGGWHAGGRAAYQRKIEEAAERGFVAVTISYRLMQFDSAQRETTTAAPIFPAQVHDAKAAVRWLRANAERYRIDPERIGATGASAGGHLALMLGLTGPDDQLEGNSGHGGHSSRVQAVVNVFGPVEMESCYRQSSVAWIFRLFLGGTPDEAPERYRQASPLNYVTADDPPVMTLHGEKDQLVPIDQAVQLDAKMKKAQRSHQLVVFPEHGHGFPGEAGTKADREMWSFFEMHLQKGTANP